MRSRAFWAAPLGIPNPSSTRHGSGYANCCPGTWQLRANTRCSGAAVGGFLLGVGAQIFILPHIDSIGGFTVVFVLVTAIRCWFMTSSPRLSYFVLQLALAYYLIHLQEFAIQHHLR